MMYLTTLLCLFLVQAPEQGKTLHTRRAGGISRAKLNGPALNDPAYQKEKSGFAIFSQCLNTIQKKWIVQAYSQAHAADLDVSLNFTIVPPRGTAKMDPMNFDVDLNGTALPNGLYHLNIQGELGDMELTRNVQRQLLVYQAGKAFSDQILPRHENANLKSYRSYALRYLGRVGKQVMSGGGYRLKYVGSGNFKGQLIDRISISKPPRRHRNKKQPVQMNRIWTFWQDGKYEVWVYQASHLPAAIFYSNPNDHIYANIEIQYKDGILPSAFFLQNNSSGFEGSSDIQLSYADNRTLQRIFFKMHSSEGHDVSFDAFLGFKSVVNTEDLRGLPPIGFRKMNPDHLKLLIMVQVAGNLLNLQKHGLHLKNFKF
jgi:hypothetical protein